MFNIALALLFIIKLWKIPKNFINYLRECYGVPGVKLYRSLEALERKKVKVDLDILFLENCKSQNVIPKFLRFKLHNKCLQTAKFYLGWQHKLLNREIQNKRQSSTKISQLLVTTRTSGNTFFLHSRT